MKLDFSLPARQLNAVLKALWAVGNECVLQVSDRGIKIRMIDPSNAAMVVVDMAPATFISFDGEEGDIGIDIREVMEKTVTFDADTVLKASFDEYNKRLVVEGEGARYGIKTIALSSVRKVPDIPDLDLPLEVEIDANRFRQMTKRAGLVSDHITIGHNAEEEFFVSSESDMNNFRQGTIDHPITIIYKSDIATLYSLDMLEPMAKIISDTVNIRIGRDLPIIMSFVLENVDVTYLLAPRIEKASGEPDM
ncbi:MAG: hypothetical protein J7K40_12110 [candidate division Zixibacteria bacterium]|nr:hypothetical protein [candidate division Zixibacteria bacterium]